MVAMLASIPQMETVRSIPRNPDVLTRHPSAEDLDAAQQLISSAQAGREHTIDRSWDDNRSEKPLEAAANQVKHESWPETPTSSNEPGEKTSPRSQKDAPFLGHSCRLVSLSFLKVAILQC